MPIVIPSDAHQVIVQGREQLAAAIKAVPHDEPHEIVLQREGGVSTWRFDYSQGTDVIVTKAKPSASFRRRTRDRTYKAPETIQARLDALAQRVLRTPARAFK